MAQRLGGAAVAAAIAEGLSSPVAALASRGIIPALAAVRIGADESDLSYERAIEKRFASAGAALKRAVLPAGAAEGELLSTLENLASDGEIHGILLLRPLPAGFDETRAARLIPAQKDVDGMTRESLASVFTGSGEGFAPCTAQAVMETLAHYGIPLSRKRVAVLGRSLVVGKPLSMLLVSKHATVTLCHSKTEDLAGICAAADVLISCTGRAHMVTPAFVNPRQTVIDVGVSMLSGRLAGDVSPEAAELVRAYTPTPGGVGSVTAAVLLKHTVMSAAKSAALKSHCEVLF